MTGVVALEADLKIDKELVRKHVRVIHRLARPPNIKKNDLVEGKLVITSFGEDPVVSKTLPPKIVHVEIGEVDETVEEIARLGAEQHRNVYMPLAVFRDDLPPGSKGSEADIIGVFGLVADFDDLDASNWADRLPVPPTCVLETSAGRFQAFYLFDQREPIEVVKPLAERLKAFARCDHGTGDLSHVWRIPGCPNWPNSKKVAAGRSRRPQLVTVVKPWDQYTITVAELDAALPPAASINDSRENDNRSATILGNADYLAGANSGLIEALVKLLPAPLRHRVVTAPTATTDRSADLFYVVSELIGHGFSDAVIKQIICQYPAGIGAKYVGRNDIDRNIARIRAKWDQAHPGGINPGRQDSGHALQTLQLNEFLAREFPPRELILSPWLPQKGLAMIHSPRGVGKTLFGLSIGYAVACGRSFLRFKAETPRRVLYLDGEMPAAIMQERLKAAQAGFDFDPPDPSFFRILSADITDGGLPDLATADGQAEIDAVIGDAGLIIIDNISTLVRSGKENEAESWLPVQGWALRHRRADRSVVFIHHAGKGGLQRGTSRREDVLDTVIALRRPADYSSEQGARFEVHFEKARGFYGDDARPFEARYDTPLGAAVWSHNKIADVEVDRVVEARSEGMSIRKTAEALGMHRSKVERLEKKAVRQGKLDN